MLHTSTWEERRTLPQDYRTQSDKFKEAARELQCEGDGARFDERVKKLVKHKPVGKPE
jgi:hypothetical protein